MEAIKHRKEPLTTIAVNKSSIDKLDKYLLGKNLSRKQFVEKAIDYFIRTDFDLNDNVSVVSPIQNALLDFKQFQDDYKTSFAQLQSLLSYVYNNQTKMLKLLPEKDGKVVEDENLAQFKVKYDMAKKMLQKLASNKTSVRVGKIRNLLDFVFNI